MTGRDARQIVGTIVVILGAIWWFGAHHGGSANPLAGANGSVHIVSMSQKDAGLGDGSFYHYVTIQNDGSSLATFVSLKGSCTNTAGTVVGTGFGDAANVAPGEQTVVTVIFLSVKDCSTIHEQIDSVLH